MVLSHENIDQITEEVSRVMNDLGAELQNREFDKSVEVKDRVIFIVFLLGWEYFKSARDTLKLEHVVGSGNLIRSSFENLADIFYMFKTDERVKKYAEAYASSLDTYKSVMLDLHSKSIDDVFSNRLAKKVNNWAGGSSIDDRLKDLTPSLLTVYDMFSYFSHPNPASITYMRIAGLKNGQLAISKSMNCHVAVVLMMIILNHSDIKSVSNETLDQLRVQIDSTMSLTSL